MSESLAGQLLLASPALVDPNFSRTVVLIGAHSAEGAMGVVLNRPSELTEATARARVFAGYAGWGEGQLEAEIDHGDWIAEPALPEDVFTEVPAELWSRVLTRKGGSYALIARMPVNPSVN